MDDAKGSNENRLIFFDNLRYLLVLCVVLQHASFAYNGLTWWPVADGSTSVVAGWLSSMFDAFTMPLLFYIAGYFALPTVRKKGIAPFLMGKLKRLGIPWLVCILTICPILPLIYHYTRDGFTLSAGYWDLWLVVMKSFARFDIGLITSMDALMRQDQFYQRYMWFLSLLLLFFFIFALVYWMKRGWFETKIKTAESKQASVSSTIRLLLAVGFLTFIPSFITIGMMLFFGPDSSNPESLFTLGNVIQFRPSRIFVFVVYFTMGILTYRNRWIERGKFPGDPKTWAVSFIVITVAYLYTRHLMLSGPEELRELFGIIFFFLLNFLTISTLGLFTSIAIKYWNRPTPVNRSLASVSYDIYLSHYIFVLAFQLLLLTVPVIPGLLKFAVVSVLSILCAYLVSRFLIKPRPRLAVATAVALLVVMALVVHP